MKLINCHQCVENHWPVPAEECDCICHIKHKKAKVKQLENKGKAALILTGIAAMASGGLALSLDFSTTETNIGDTTIVNNYIKDNFGVDIEVFKEMCRNDEVPDEAKIYCRLIGA